ncbi:HNH endonuclease [Escherichia coli]|nr:HNH endonuclease [Escherichia coli]
MKNNQIKFQYVTEHYYLDDGVVYRRDTHDVVPFNVKCRRDHRNTIIKVNGKQMALAIHDVVWMLFHGKPIPEGDFHIHHKDFNPLNNAPDNLVLMSRRLHFAYHRYINGSKGYRFSADPTHHLKPWEAQVKLPIGRCLHKYFATESEAAAFVEYHRRPIIKAFEQLGLPV